MSSLNSKEEEEKITAIFSSLARQFEESGPSDMAANLWWNILEGENVQQEPSWNGLATYFLQKKEYKRALIYYERAVVNDPENFEFRYDYAQHLFYMEKYKEAAETFKILVGMKPNDPAALYEYGISLMLVKDFNSALSCFTKAKNIAEKQGKNYIAEKAEDRWKICYSQRDKNQPQFIEALHRKI